MMIQKILLPKLGQTMEEATVERWLKSEGEEVKRGDVILEITTDKATLEVESYAEGVLRKILAKDGTVVAVNEPVGIVAGADEQIPAELLNYVPRGPEEKRKPARAPQPAPRAAAEAPPPRPLPAAEHAEEPVPYVVPATAAAKPVASPRAKRAAREGFVPLRVLSGSGPGGRIVEEDVIELASDLDRLDVTPAARALAAEKGIDLRSLTGSGPDGRITREDVGKAEPPAAVRAEEPSAMRRIVAERMSWSWRNVPQFSIVCEADVGKLLKLKSRLKKNGNDVGLTAFIVKAAADALGEHPGMRALYHEGRLYLRAAVDVGVAVAIEEGLVVPVVRGADALGLEELALKLRDLAERARTHRLTPDEYSGGVLTVSNLGMFGVDEFRAIVNPGEAAILAVGRASEKPRKKGKRTSWSSFLKLTLSADHRAVDGATAARFLGDVKKRLESP